MEVKSHSPWELIKARDRKILEDHKQDFPHIDITYWDNFVMLRGELDSGTWIWKYGHPAEIEALYEMWYWATIENIAMNPNTPNYILEELVNSVSAKVSRIAKMNLDKRRQSAPKHEIGSKLRQIIKDRHSKSSD